MTTSLIAYEVESHSGSQYPYSIDAGFKPLPLSQCIHYNGGKNIGVMVFMGFDGQTTKPFIERDGRIVAQNFTEVRIVNS